MIKVRGTLNGKDTVILGLSFGNLRRFKAQPLDTHIHIPGEELGLTHDILIFSGKTEDALMKFVTEELGRPKTQH